MGRDPVPNNAGGRAERKVSPDCRPPGIITALTPVKILSEPREVRNHLITFRVNDMEFEEVVVDTQKKINEE